MAHATSACKFVEGGQLDEVVKRTPMSIRQAAELIAKVARTVHYAHEHGILHRDIKPGNILLDKNGEPHLTDFGLARLLDTQSSVTRTIDVLGTPSYMAPEQAAGENTKLTSATDVYGLGAVLLSITDRSAAFCWRNNIRNDPSCCGTPSRGSRASLNPKIDRDLSTICLKCLEKDPKRRYSSALATRRRPRTLATARADPRKAKWIHHTRPQMDPTKSKHDRASRVVDGACSGS